MKSKLFIPALLLIVSAAFAQETVNDSALANRFERFIYGPSFNITMPTKEQNVVAIQTHPYRTSNRNYIAYRLNDRAYISGSRNNITLFGALETESNKTNVSFGYATPTFGADFLTTTSLKWESLTKTESEKKISESDFTSFSRSMYQLILSKKFSDLDFTVTGAFIRPTDDSSYTREVNTRDYSSEYNKDDHNWEALLQFELTNFPSAKDFSWSFNAKGFRYNVTYDSVYSVHAKRNSDDDFDEYNYELNTRSSCTLFGLNYGFSNVTLKASNARLILGLTTDLSVKLYDALDDKIHYNKDNYFTVSLKTNPEILAELAISDNWTLYSDIITTLSANFDRNEFDQFYRNKENHQDNSSTNLYLKNGYTSIRTGLRFDYNNFALEGIITDSFIANPFCSFAGHNMTSTLFALVNF